MRPYDHSRKNAVATSMPLRAGTGASGTSTGTPDDAVQSLAAPPEDFEPTSAGVGRSNPYYLLKVVIQTKFAVVLGTAVQR